MLLDADHFTISQKAKLVELTAQFDIRDAAGTEIGNVTEVGHGAAHKTIRALTGGDAFLNRRLEVRDATGDIVAVVSRNRGLWRYIVTVSDGAGREVGQVRVRLFAPSLPLPMGHAVRDAAGTVRGRLRTHGLRRRKATLELDGAVVASSTQPWAGMLREAFTQADRYVFDRVPGANADAALAPLVFSLPLIVELAFKQGGGMSPLGEATGILGDLV